MSSQNPLTRVQYQIPFDQIRADHVEPAIDTLLTRAQTALDTLVGTDAVATYENTLAELERLGEELEFAIGVVGHLESVATHPELRTAYNRVRPKVSAFFSAIPLNAGVWSRIRAFSGTQEANRLGPTRKRFLDKTVADFRRSGAELGSADKERLLDIDVELAKITTSFSENVLDATNAFEHVIQDEAALAGLPPSAVEAARESAAAKGQAGWRFTLQAPSYLAVMTYLDDAAVREKLYRAHCTRASGGRFDNREAILRILALRQEKARLLGYANFADLVLEDRMAKSGARAWEFVDGLRERTRTAFERENAELEAYSGQSPPTVGPGPTRPRSCARSSTSSTKRTSGPTSLTRGVLRGLFEIAGRLFGIRVEPRDGVSGLGRCGRLLQRPGTRTAATSARSTPTTSPGRTSAAGRGWTSLLTGEPTADGFSPHLGLNCGNLTPPAGGKPALLTHREVETIFHEFGHLLHHLLSRVEVKSLAGNPCRVGLGGAAVPDHGELVLGARGPGPLRPATTKPVNRFPSNCSVG